MTAAQLNDLPLLVDGTDLKLQTPHDSDPTSSSSNNDDGNGKGPPKKPPGGTGRGAASSPPPPPPPTQEEAFAAHLAQTLKKTITPDTGRRLPVKAPETFDGEFTKFRGWWKVMQRFLRIYASHIPDDTTRIDVVSTYLKNDAPLWHEARGCLLEQNGKIDNSRAFLFKIDERFRDKQETDKDHKKILPLKYEGSIHTFFAKLDELNSRVGLNGEAYKKF